MRFFAACDADWKCLELFRAGSRAGRFVVYTTLQNFVFVPLLMAVWAQFRAVSRVGHSFALAVELNTFSSQLVVLISVLG